jgi:hypothetical protein
LLKPEAANDSLNVRKIQPTMTIITADSYSNIIFGKYFKHTPLKKKEGRMSKTKRMVGTLSFI